MFAYVLTLARVDRWYNEHGMHLLLNIVHGRAFFLTVFLIVFNRVVIFGITMFVPAV